MKILLHRKTDIFCFDGVTEFIDSFNFNIISAKRRDFGFQQNKIKGNVIKSTKKIKDRPKTTEGLKKKKPNRMAFDKVYLEKFTKRIEKMKLEGQWGSLVANKANEGIKFLEKRNEFWNQIDTS